MNTNHVSNCLRLPAEGPRRPALRPWHLATVSHSHNNSHAWTYWEQRAHWVRLVWEGPQRSCAPRAPPMIFRAEPDNAGPNEDPVSIARNALEPHSPTYCADQCESQARSPFLSEQLLHVCPNLGSSAFTPPSSGLRQHSHVTFPGHPDYRHTHGRISLRHDVKTLYHCSHQRDAESRSSVCFTKTRCGPHCLFDCFLDSRCDPSETRAHAEGLPLPGLPLQEGQRRSCTVSRFFICEKHLSYRPGPNAILSISTVLQGPRRRFPRPHQHGSDLLTSPSWLQVGARNAGCWQSHR